MKLVVRAKLLPDEATETALRETLRVCNLAANHASRRAFETGITGKIAVENKPIRFRKDAAQPFDDRCLSWQLDTRTVSIWTVHGRSGRIPFQCSPAHTQRGSSASISASRTSPPRPTAPSTLGGT